MTSLCTPELEYLVGDDLALLADDLFDAFVGHSEGAGDWDPFVVPHHLVQLLLHLGQV